MARLDPPRTTARLRLRPLEAGDLDDLVAILSDPSVNRYLYTEPRTPDETRALLDRRLACDADPEDPVITLAATRRDDGRLVGDFMVRWDPVHRQGEIGGVVAPAYQGRGLAPEVYGELLAVAFEDLGLHRVFAKCDARNAASVRSLEKAGLRREAHLVENEFVKGEWTSEVVLAILAEEWRRGR